MSSLKQFLNDKSNKSEIDQYFEDQAKFLIEKQKLERIDNFNGYFDFLNNDYPCEIYYEGLVFKSVSHAYQAARSTLQHIREKIALSDTIMEMYEIAAKIDDPPDWQKNRLRVMERLVRDKFRRHRDLRDRLKATGQRELLNTYADQTTSNLFWGVVDGKGQNQLGRIMENIRHDILTNVELEKWLFITFDLVEDKALIPILTLEVFKGENKIETLKLEGKSHYMMGSLNSSDVLMAHQSISRHHSALIIDSKEGVCLVDLGSKGGSFIDGQRLGICYPYKVKTKQVLNFAASTRRYAIYIDYSQVEKNLMKRRRQVELEMKMFDELKDPNTNPEFIKASLGLVIEDTIFVAGLPDHCSVKDLKDFFEQFGTVKDIRIPIDHVTGKTRNYAFIAFKDEKDMQNAVKQNGIYYKNCKLRINKAEKKSMDQLIGKDKGKDVSEIKNIGRNQEQKILTQAVEKVIGTKDDKNKNKEQKEKERDKEKKKMDSTENVKLDVEKKKVNQGEGGEDIIEKNMDNKENENQKKSKKHYSKRSKSRSRSRSRSVKKRRRHTKSNSRDNSRSYSKDKKKKKHKKHLKKKNKVSRSRSKSISRLKSRSRSNSKIESKSRSNSIHDDNPKNEEKVYQIYLRGKRKCQQSVWINREESRLMINLKNGIFLSKQLDILN